MKKISIVFVAALALAAFGCKKKSADSGSGSATGSGSGAVAAGGGGGGDCSAAIANSMEVAKANITKMPGVDDKMLAQMRDLGLQHCTDDKWSDDVVKCMTGAKTQADAQACYGKLTPEQQDAMNKGMIHLMTPPGGAGSAGSGSAPAAGSDMGSGSAGSAAPQ